MNIPEVNSGDQTAPTIPTLQALNFLIVASLPNCVNINKGVNWGTLKLPEIEFTWE